MMNELLIPPIVLVLLLSWGHIFPIHYSLLSDSDGHQFVDADKVVVFFVCFVFHFNAE